MTDIETNCQKQKAKGRVTVKILPVHPALKKRFEEAPAIRKDWDLGFRIAHEGEVIEIAYGNPWEAHTKESCHAYVLDEGHLRVVRIGWDAEIVEGSLRLVYFPPSPYMGRSSMMAHIGKAIKAGKIGR